MMERKKVTTPPFAFTEEELSEEARAILGYARWWAEPFTRAEITDVAPGAAWEPFAGYPRTMARLDPIKELLRAGWIQEHDEQPVKNDQSGKKRYKRYVLVGVDAPLSLAGLLEQLHGAIGEGRSNIEEIKAEILRRFSPYPYPEKDREPQ